ncbi:MAG TPA: hypothetical protein PLA71_01010 [Saccharofermentans sp.]|nr:hypothetical protein [Saccharofermentans sp.]
MEDHLEQLTKTNHGLCDSQGSHYDCYKKDVIASMCSEVASFKQLRVECMNDRRERFMKIDERLNNLERGWTTKARDVDKKIEEISNTAAEYTSEIKSLMETKEKIQTLFWKIIFIVVTFIVTGFCAKYIILSDKPINIDARQFIEETQSVNFGGKK